MRTAALYIVLTVTVVDDNRARVICGGRVRLFTRYLVTSLKATALTDNRQVQLQYLKGIVMKIGIKHLNEAICNYYSKWLI